MIQRLLTVACLTVLPLLSSDCSGHSAASSETTRSTETQTSAPSDTTAIADASASPASSPGEAASPASSAEESASTQAGASDAAPCLRVESESYCRAWSANDSDGTTRSEFVRAGETVDHWQRMVTIIRYNNLSSLKEAVPAYLAGVRQFMGRGATPQWLAPTHGSHQQALATRLVLTSTDPKFPPEYVVAYFFHDSGPPYGVIFSQHPLASGDIPSPKHYGDWLADLDAVQAAKLSP